jgi:predicted NBD/HSP70 family sugar kinase
MKEHRAQQLKMIGVREVRDINQTIFLHLIRERQPISRADIAKATGLRPGTVSAIVNRLIKEKLIYEGVEGPSTGGRPPKYLYVNAESAYVLAIDVGVHETTYAVSDFNGRIMMQRAVITEGQPELFLKSLGKEINALVQSQYPRARFEAVGVSVPGLVDRADGSLIISPNLGWQNIPVRALLEAELMLPVFVENDANASAFAELWYGPLDELNARTLLFVLVVEGLGTGLIINGELHVGTSIGLGGFGHMTLDPNGPLCSCGRHGCWETFASDSATVARYNEKAGTDIKARSVTQIISLANQGDETARSTIETTARYLGEGIVSLAHGLSPQVIVLGGEIAGAWQIVEPIIRACVKSTYIIPPMNIIIRPSSVQRPGLFGAIPIALQHLFGDRSEKSQNDGKAMSSSAAWTKRLASPRYALSGQSNVSSKLTK